MGREERRHSRNYTAVSILLIVLLGFSVYANSLDNQFIWDDNYLIRNNVNLRSPSGILKIFTSDIGSAQQKNYNVYRPMFMFTYVFDYWLWKLDARGYHLTSIILHILSALSLFWLLNLLFEDKALSLLTSLLFVVHPVSCEAVTYIAGRSDPLAAIFVLLCFILYLKLLKRSDMLLYVFMTLSYTLALLSKEYSLVLPAFILLYHYALKKKFSLKVFSPFIILAAVYLSIRFTLLFSISHPAEAGTTLLQRVPGFFVALANYARLLVLPFGLHLQLTKSMFSFSDPRAMAGVVLLAGLLFYALKSRNKDPFMCFSLLWFFVGILPVSNLYPLNVYMAEHFLYLPAIGIFLIFAKGLTYLFRTKKFKAVSLILIIGVLSFYSVLTIRQNEYWQEPVSFFEKTLQYVKNSPALYNELGITYAGAGKYREAAESYKKALSIDPRFIESYNNLGALYNDLGRHGEAIEYFKKALEIDPNYAAVYSNLGISLYNTGRFQEAIEAFKRAIRIKPDYPEAYNNLGAAYGILGRYDEALVLYKKALQINPGYGQAHNNMAIIYRNKQEYDLAIQHCDRAIELGYRVDAKLIEQLEPFRKKIK